MIKKKNKLAKRIKFLIDNFRNEINDESICEELEDILKNHQDVKVIKISKNEIVKRMAEKTQKVDFLPFGPFILDEPKEEIKSILTKSICGYSNLYSITSEYMGIIAKGVEKLLLRRNINIRFCILFKGSIVMRSHIINFKKNGIRFAENEFAELYPMSDNDTSVKIESYEGDYQVAFDTLMDTFYEVMHLNCHKLYEKIHHLLRNVYWEDEVFVVDLGLNFRHKVLENGVKLIFEDFPVFVNTQSNFIKSTNGDVFGLIRHKIFFRTRFGTLFPGELIDVGFQHRTSQNIINCDESQNLICVNLKKLNGSVFDF